MSESSSRGAQYFARLSQELMVQSEETPTLQTVVDRAADVIGPCTWAGISLRRSRGRLETVASSHDIATECDQLQHALGEGPCVEAALQEDWLFSPDLSADRRWPRWAPRAEEQGVRSVVAVRLATVSENLGALNLYSDEAGVWDRDELDLALVYAAHAANALSSARLASGLQIALEGRHNIGVAQGILMLRYEVTQQQSFDLLRRLSSEHNIKLRELAARVVELRELPVELVAHDATGDQP